MSPPWRLQLLAGAQMKRLLHQAQRHVVEVIGVDGPLALAKQVTPGPRGYHRGLAMSGHGKSTSGAGACHVGSWLVPVWVISWSWWAANSWRCRDSLMQQDATGAEKMTQEQPVQESRARILTHQTRFPITPNHHHIGDKSKETINDRSNRRTNHTTYPKKISGPFDAQISTSTVSRLQLCHRLQGTLCAGHRWPVRHCSAPAMPSLDPGKLPMIDGVSGRNPQPREEGSLGYL